MDYFMSLKINTDSIKQRLMTVCIGNAQGYGQTPNAVPYNGLLDVSHRFSAKAVASNGRNVSLVAG